MARADVFGDQLLRHILAFVPRSSELAKQYSFQPKTEHYLVKAGWPVVLKKCVIGRKRTPSVVAAVPTKNPAIQTSQTIAGHLSKSLLAGQGS